MARTYTMYICIGSDEKYSIQWYTMKSGGFHDEIWQISWWNSADFMVKFGRFHAWNLADFMAMKSGGFHAKDFGSDEKYSIQW